MTPKPFLLQFFALIFLDIKFFEKNFEKFLGIILFLFLICHILWFSICFIRYFGKSTFQISQSRHNFVLFRSFWKPPVFRFWHVGFRFQSVTYNSGSVRFRFASKRPVSVRFSVISVNRHITSVARRIRLKIPPLFPKIPLFGIFYPTA